MQVKTADNLFFSRQSSEFFLYGHDVGVKQLIGFFPTSVQVSPAEVASKVPVDDPIDVDHREYPKGELFQQPLFVCEGVPQQLSDERFYKKGRPNFSRVLSGQNDNVFLCRLR